MGAMLVVLVGRVLRAAAQNVERSPVGDLLECVGADEFFERAFFRPSRHDQVDGFRVPNLAVERGGLMTADVPHGLDDFCAGILEDLFLAGDDKIVHADGDHAVLLSF